MKFREESKNANTNQSVYCFPLTVGGHEEASVDLFGVAEVWLNLFPAGIKLPPVNAAGFDVQHVETDLPATEEEKKSNTNKVWFVFCWPVLMFSLSKMLTLIRIWGGPWRRTCLYCSVQDEDKNKKHFTYI